MPSLNHGSSIYHEIQALYWRSADGHLLATEGRLTPQVQQAWSQLWPKIRASADGQKLVELSSGGWFHVTPLAASDYNAEQSYARPLTEQNQLVEDAKDELPRVYEMRRAGEDNIIGLVSMVSAASENRSEFREWFCRFVLAETHFLPLKHVKDAAKANPQALEMAERITAIFDKELRNVASDDQWMDGGGRDYFLDRVFGFTQRNATVKACLPAFPCKSSNQQKTKGASPDRAEEIALKVLRSFSHQVAAIYPPGARVCIISDGHVFSDCIGVDDDMVDNYGHELQGMARELSERRQDQGVIDFVSLWDIYFSNPELQEIFSLSMVDNVELAHFVQTQLSEGAELCRRMLMASCQIGSNVLKNLIKGDDKGTVALYRGFSRFMLEDLAVHPSCMGLSVSKRKKLASKVAGEMIKRNQAYSNLAELMFPSHVRLSIHAHDNRGPKFGIRLFPHPAVRPIKSLEDRKEPPTEELLHIPTPWHNCILEVQGDPTLYLTKSRVALEAMGDNRYHGAWTSPDGGIGGKSFVLSEAAPSLPRRKSDGTPMASLHRL